MLLIRWLCTAVLAGLTAVAQAADPYPSKPLRIIVYVGPGTLVDVSTRLVADKLAEQLRQPVVVENMAGASGLLGIRHVKGSAPDGYTLLAATNTVAQAPVLLAAPGFELKDFVAIGAMNQAALMMVGTTSQPARSLAQLLDQAKRTPDALSFASGGVGTSTYLSAAMLLQQSGAKMLHVPYKGTGAAMPDVVGGRVNFVFDAENSAGPHVREGRLQAFGVSSTTRSKNFPDVPTLAEQGLPNYAYTLYNGLVAPAGTPKEVVQRLAEALRSIVTSDAVRERFRKDGSEAWVQSPEEFDEFLRRDSQRIARLAAEMGMDKQ